MLRSGLALDYRAFRLPRRGYAVDECQDAFAGDAERGRFAIADGAAESPYAALWARLLVEEFVKQSEPLPRWADWLPSLQERWSKKVSGTVSGEKVPDTFFEDMPWYLEPGLHQGAFATLLALRIEEQRWQALAVGDSCLFQVHQGELVQAFPITRAVDFSNAPWLVGSRSSRVEMPSKIGVQQQGDWQPGDRLWLMTDALAKWFLTEVEAGNKPWLALETLLSANGDAQQMFVAWIEALRLARRLRNDDVTLLVIGI